MRAHVTEQGLVIPREWLQGVAEVEIRHEDDTIIITPIVMESDPLASLGDDPIVLDISDASIVHDIYLTP